MNKRSKSSRRDCNIYVIRLDPAVLNHLRFRERNPDHDPRKPCVYVGMTYRTPQERFDQHLAGYKACRYVKKYGRQLMPKKYEKLNPLTRTEAKQKEVALAVRLRARGYAVWQN